MVLVVGGEGGLSKRRGESICFAVCSPAMIARRRPDVNLRSGADLRRLVRPSQGGGEEGRSTRGELRILKGPSRKTPQNQNRRPGGISRSSCFEFGIQSPIESSSRVDPPSFPPPVRVFLASSQLLALRRRTPPRTRSAQRTSFDTC